VVNTFQSASFVAMQNIHRGCVVPRSLGSSEVTSYKGSFLRTVREYNDAVHQHRMEHPGSKWDLDGLSTQSSRKSLIACGIIFTFGGLAIDPGIGGVLSESGGVIRGLALER